MGTDRVEKDRHSALLAILAFSACSIAAAAGSRGFLESDGATHFIFARHALEEPMFFVDVWGRPLCTGLLALPAYLGGLLWVRLASLCCAIGCAIVAMAIARGQGLKEPVLALVFTLGQPLLFFHSFSELTELPFALVMGLAFLCWQRKRWWAMATFAAIGPLGRPEGFAFLILAAAVLTANRKWVAMLVLPVGVIAWSIAGHLLQGPADQPWWKWLVEHWPYESGSEYPRGPIFYYLAVLPMIVGPFALPAVWMGVWRSVKSASAGDRRTVDWAIALLPMGLLAGYSVLFWLGKFSSSGSPRYLLIVAPLWGCLAARGWEWVFERMRWQQAVSWAALAVVVPGVVNWVYPFLPLKQSASWSQAEKFVAWYGGSEFRKSYPRVLCNHPGIYFFLGVSPWDRRAVVPWWPDAIDHPEAGVVLVWDRDFCTTNSDPRLVATLDRVRKAGWVEVDSAEGLSDVNHADVPKVQLKWDREDEWRIFVAK
jgi:hypothetical protein